MSCPMLSKFEKDEKRIDYYDNKITLNKEWLTIYTMRSWWGPA